MWWDVAGRGEEGVTQELEVASAAGAEGLLKAGGCQPGMSQGQHDLSREDWKGLLRICCYSESYRVDWNKDWKQRLLLLQGHSGRAFSSLYFCSAAPGE